MRPGFNPRSSHAKDFLKMVLDATLLKTQHYKVRIKVKWSNPGKSVVAIEKGAFWSPSTMVANFTYVIKLRNDFFYINHFSLIIFNHSVWLGFELFGS